MKNIFKDVFSESISEVILSDRDKTIFYTFSFLGNQNNPSDAILRNGDVIEVKKTKVKALNGILRNY